MKKASIKVYIYSIDYYEQEFHYLFLHIYIMKKEPLHFHLSPVLSATTTLAALSFSSHHTQLFIIYAQLHLVVFLSSGLFKILPKCKSHVWEISVLQLDVFWRVRNKVLLFVSFEPMTYASCTKKLTNLALQIRWMLLLMFFFFCYNPTMDYKYSVV